MLQIDKKQLHGLLKERNLYRKLLHRCIQEYKNRKPYYSAVLRRLELMQEIERALKEAENE